MALGGRGSTSEGVCGLRLEGSCDGTGDEDSDAEVALLPRDCGRDDSKELDEELVLSDGLRRRGGVPESGEAVGSTMIGFALRFSTAIAQDSQPKTKDRYTKKTKKTKKKLVLREFPD